MTPGEVLADTWNAQRDAQYLRLFIESRGLARWVRGVISMLTVLLAVIAAVSLASPSGAAGPVGRSVVLVVTVAAAFWAVRWNVGRWPSFQESVAFLAFADLSIAVVCFFDTNVVAGQGGVVLLVLMGTYTTFFLGPRVLAVHVVWCCLAIVVLSVRVATDPDFDAALAVAKALMLIATAVVVPVLIEVGVHMIRADADMSLTDPLTGLSNRRGMRIRLSLLAEGSQITMLPVAAVIVLDLDRFKRINDTFGHQAGDEVLVRVGASVEAVCGSSATVARYGGEEFLVFDLYADIAAAHAAAESVRDAIALAPGEPGVTASIGVATCPTAATMSDTEAISEMIDRSDAAMYQAKAAGGDRVVVAGGVDPSGPRLVLGR